jgi:hypothetical protein
MSEKYTPRQVVEDAKALYSNHKVAAHLIENPDPDNTHEPKLNDFDKEVGIDEPYDHYIDWQGAYDANARVAQRFAEEHGEELQTNAHAINYIHNAVHADYPARILTPPKH